MPLINLGRKWKLKLMMMSGDDDETPGLILPVFVITIILLTLENSLNNIFKLAYV